MVRSVYSAGKITLLPSELYSRGFGCVGACVLKVTFSLNWIALLFHIGA